jgi:hypothetical protein
MVLYLLTIVHMEFWSFSYKYNRTENLLQTRLTNQPFFIDDLDDDVFLQTLLEDWIHTLKIYFQALEERDI